MLNERRNVFIGHSGKVIVTLWLARESASQGTHGRLSCAHSIGIGPIENHADALLHAASGLRLFQPDWKQALADKWTFDVIDQTVPKPQEGVFL